MRAFYLFELFLGVFAFYAILYEIGIRILVPIMCLITIFLFERLKTRLKEADKDKDSLWETIMEKDEKIIKDLRKEHQEK
jgi:hypothetical protein